MLTRRHIRAKVLETIYAQRVSGIDIFLAEKNLLKGALDAFDLYCSLLDLLLAIGDLAENSMEIGKKKYFKTTEDLNSSRKFIDNPVFARLRKNNELLNHLNHKDSVNWKEESQYVSNIWSQIRQTDEYKCFMANGEEKEDYVERLIAFIYVEIIAENKPLREYIEDRNMYWWSYLAVVNTMALKTIENCGRNERLIQVFRNEEDKCFMTQLFRKTALHSKDNRAFLDTYFKNWEADRVADIDFIAMEMALIEFLHFSNIPIKVTLNEYIELVSEYSTPKSKLFVNGVLDKVLKDLGKEQKIKKSGRGLLN